MFWGKCTFPAQCTTKVSVHILIRRRDGVWVTFCAASTAPDYVNAHNGTLLEKELQMWGFFLD